MELDHFIEIKRLYGAVASWALWAESDSGDTSDLSIFDATPQNEKINRLHSNFVFVALNISGPLSQPFSNFHGGKRDFMLRDAVRGTALEGAYITDLIKNYEDKNASSVVSYFKKNKDELSAHLRAFVQELNVIRANEDTTLVALGNGVFDLLADSSMGHRVRKMTHYSAPVSKLAYRKEVNDLLNSLK